MRKVLGFLLCFFIICSSLAFKPIEKASSELQVVKIDASTKEERTKISSLGVSIEEVYDHYIVGFCHEKELAKLSKQGFNFRVQSLPAFLLDFPPSDSAFHNLKELNDEILALSQTYASIMTLSSIGKSVEGKDLTMIRISGPQNKIFYIFFNCPKQRRRKTSYYFSGDTSCPGTFKYRSSFLFNKIFSRKLWKR